MNWHRNPGPGPTWITDEELAEKVEENAAETRRSEILGSGGLSGPIAETSEETREFVGELAEGMREARANGYRGGR